MIKKYSDLSDKKKEKKPEKEKKEISPREKTRKNVELGFGLFGLAPLGELLTKVDKAIYGSEKQADAGKPVDKNEKPLQEQLNRHMVEPLKKVGKFQQRFITLLTKLYSDNISAEKKKEIHNWASEINVPLNATITAMKEFKPQKVSHLLLNNLFRKRTASKHIAAVSPENIQEVLSWRDALKEIWTGALSAKQYIPPERYERLKASLTRLFEVTDQFAIFLKSIQ